MFAWQGEYFAIFHFVETRTEEGTVGGKLFSVIGRKKLNLNVAWCWSSVAQVKIKHYLCPNAEIYFWIYYNKKLSLHLEC